MNITNNKRSYRQTTLLTLLLLTPVIAYFAYILSPILARDNFFNALIQLSNGNIDFFPEFTSKTITNICFSVVIYVGIVFLWFYSAPDIATKDTHGSAKWGEAKKLNKKYSATNLGDEFNNIRMTEHFALALDGVKYKHFRNNNVLVVGGPGSGKTRYWVKPNIMQMCSSYIVLDPKGEILKDLGTMLEENDYRVVYLDLKDMEKSYCYNPFNYIKNEQDALILINNLIKNTTPPESKSSDPFWEKAETALLMALVLYLWTTAIPEEQNFNTVCFLLGQLQALQDNAEYQLSRERFIDSLFYELSLTDPNNLSLRYFNDFRKYAPGKTAQSILMSVAVRLSPFYLKSMQRVLAKDELNLELIGKEKTALFLLISDVDSTFNFFISMLYTQLFQCLYAEADSNRDNKLKIPVQVIMDEFANVSTPPNFLTVLGTSRSRGISISIIVQAISQLKKKFKDNEWETIIGNCDSFLYLGGNEQSSHEYISKKLGAETIQFKNTSQSKGRSGSFSTSFQTKDRNLLNIDEIARLDRNKALYFLTGELPILDEKINLEKHPRFNQTMGGGGKIFEH